MRESRDEHRRPVMSALGNQRPTALFSQNADSPDLTISESELSIFALVSRRCRGIACESREFLGSALLVDFRNIYTCLKRTRGRIVIRSFACISRPLYSALRFPQLRKQRVGCDDAKLTSFAHLCNVCAVCVCSCLLEQFLRSTQVVYRSCTRSSSIDWSVKNAARTR